MHSSETTKILLLGATRYTSVFVDSFESIREVQFVACVENIDRNRCASLISDLPVLWSGDIDAYRVDHRLICVLATTHRRHWILDVTARGFTFATLVHQTCAVSSRTSLGTGTSVDAGTVIAAYSTIGEHVRIGRQASIGHHTEIGDFSTVHPGAIISGNCKIGRGVTLGTGCVIIDGMEIGDDAVIAAGAVVTRKVPQGSLFAGNPATLRKQDYGPV